MSIEWRTATESERVLLSQAEEARNRAYAPYSDFPVGAALATDNGVFLGVNVENAALGSTICAEAAAVASAHAAGSRDFKAIAVAGRDGESCVPCGNCRQILNEFGDVSVVVDGPAGPVSALLSELLPASFGRERL